VKALVTGGAGFIGSSLCAALVSRGDKVVALDNFSKGTISNISQLRRTTSFTLIKGNVRSPKTLRRALGDSDVVFHLAASPEVRLDRAGPRINFVENVTSTLEVLEAMKHSSAHTLVFASSSTVYGDATVHPTPEDYSPMLPISIYGACKLASEALAEAYSKTYGFNVTILRFANIVGKRSGHGVVPDFIEKLRANPKVLEILGDGSQAKSYLHVDDCVSAINVATSLSEGVSVYNVGSEDQTDVRSVADIVCEEMRLRPRYRFTGGVDGGRGWQGDVKKMLMDVGKLKSCGWKPKYNSAEAVRVTTRQIIECEPRKLR
jgi:UDP-glucose 4-epimerase